ncbi:Starch-binding associating with outer membrane [Mariniphaga anaerophila]|uniref:Starch-binding associating with outer membrane n=1 Tax=Mariniphaga anaerophila TaxID=1484053 RepID=A0A1M5EMN2_9BACT|nr:RagB/SusD family nutrient uptake outer membrane protein [Mariniphaga anaerophila]SHF80467.1 Starch-binding associating with outer membrane [Mariniphaga anaerophila]
MKYKALIIIMFFIAGCNTLDVPPINIVQDDATFANESGIDAYMAGIYKELPYEDFTFTRDDPQSWYCNHGTNTFSGEITACPSDLLYDYLRDEDFTYWAQAYSSIRDVNYFLATLPNYAENYSNEVANKLKGEALFLRAFIYFSIVKRYGGVPIITEVQNYPEQSIEELQVPRNTESEVYKFIEKDLVDAISLLDEGTVANGRANKNVALALKSRAMLYAGSIAKYGTVQLNGLIGIPNNEAEYFYNSSYDASVALKEKFSLYNKYSDKYENFLNMFLDENSPENIFISYYKYPDNAHSFQAITIPYQMRGPQGYSSRWCPTLELVEKYDDINGNSGVLKVNDDNGNPLRFDQISDLFANVQPRLRATVMLPGDKFKGEIIDVQKGIFTSYPNGEKLVASDHNILHNGRPIIGASGIGHNEMTATGFFNRKYQNPSLSKAEVLLENSENNFILFRYGEVLLNEAEAAFNIDDKKNEALIAINKIRDRAGAKLLTMDELTVDNIRRERRMELALESQNFWDIRRWRIADSEINNKQFTSLCPYYVEDENKYIFTKEKIGGNLTFQPKNYYVKIPGEEISKNPNLIQNPGY